MGSQRIDSEPRTDRRVARTKRNIRAAFVALIQERDLNDITVTELSRRADVDRKTFYAHYDTVPDVYRELLAEISGELDRALAADGNLSWEAFVGVLADIMTRNRAFFQAIATRDSYAYLVDECRGVLLRHLLARKEADLGSAPDLAANVRCRAAASAIVSTYIDWLRGDLQGSLEETTAALADATGKMLQA